MKVVVFILSFVLARVSYSDSLTPKEKVEDFLIRPAWSAFLLGTETESLWRKSSEIKKSVRFDKEKIFQVENLKVAIDPGHIGGEFSRLEERHVRIKGQEGVVKEGDLTLRTAQIVKEKLEALGVEVMLTREKNDTSHLPMSFEEWSKKNNSQDFKRGYLSYDRTHRAEKINNFQPHITFIIHFDAKGVDGAKPATFTKTNYVYSYVPGNFMSGELNTEESKDNFKRLAETKDLSQSRRLCEILNEELSKSTKVAIKSTLDGGRNTWRRERYVSRPWWGQFFSAKSTGVYARNLDLTRRVQGALCFGETFTQNNDKEFFLLREKNEERLAAVAEGYVQATLRYVKEQD